MNNRVYLWFWFVAEVKQLYLLAKLYLKVTERDKTHMLRDMPKCLAWGSLQWNL